jgi:hypothetical protein
MRSISKRLALSLMMWAAAQRAGAATIITSPVEFTSPTIFIGFEAFPTGEPVPAAAPILEDQWRSLGMIISDSSPQDGASAFAGIGGGIPVPAHTGMRAVTESERLVSGYIDFRFVISGTDNPGTVTEAGLWVQNNVGGATVSFFDSTDVLLESIVTEPFDDFAGLLAPEGIARIRVESGGAYLVDDLQFTPVPEPAAASLIVAAAASLVGRRRGRTISRLRPRLRGNEK